MGHFKLNPHIIIFFSLIVFLLLDQSISEHENAPHQLVKDSKLLTSHKTDLFGHESNEEEKNPHKHKMTKKEKKEKKEKEKEEEEKRHKDDKNKKKKKKKKNDEDEGDEDMKKKKKHNSSYKFNSVDSLLHLSQVTNTDPTAPPEIQQGCEHTDYPGICEVTLLSLMKDTQNLDASTFFVTSTKAMSQALRAAKTSVLDHEMSVGAKDASLCLQLYGDASHALKSALKAHMENDRYMTLLHLSSVISDIDTCQGDGWSNDKPNFAQLNLVLWKLASNAMGLGSEAMPPQQ